MGIKYEKMHFFEKKMPKYLVISKKSSTFAPAFEISESLETQFVHKVLHTICLPSSVGRATDS